MTRKAAHDALSSHCGLDVAAAAGPVPIEATSLGPHDGAGSLGGMLTPEMRRS